MLSYDEALEKYIETHIDAEPADLHALYRETHLRCLYPRMCSGHYQGRLLKMLTAMVRPRRVLELGTFTGYSALCIAEGMDSEGIIDTIEIDCEKEEHLRNLFDASDYAGRINVFIGDALSVIPTLPHRYDMVFIDANKRHYRDYLELVLPMVPVGGFILADNTLWDMKVVSETGHPDIKTDAIARFNDFVAADPRLEKVILPVRDGLTIMRRVK